MATVRKWTLPGGSIKYSLWPKPPRIDQFWTPVEAEMKAILALPGVEEISRESKLACKIVLGFDSHEQMDKLLPGLSTQILAIITKYHTV